MIVPRTLFGRTALVIALVSIAFQIFTIAVITYFALLPLGRHATDDFAALMMSAAQAWQTAAPDERGQLQNELRRTHRLQVQDPPVAAQNFPRLLPYFFFLESALSKRSGQTIVLHKNIGTDGQAWYWADLPAGNRSVRVGFPSSRVSVQPSLALLIILAAGAIVTFITSAWLARWLIKPLARLAAATQRIGQGQRPAPLPETGPSELATVAREFNRMGEQVEELLANRTTLLAGISHDLRSPLARIQLALGMLSEKPDRELLERIMHDVEGMNDLIARCLEIGRDFAEKDEVELNLCELLAEIAQEYAVAGADIRGHKGPQCCLHVRPLALRRILSNLLDNAVRYGDGNPIDIEYRLGNEMVEICVSDRGSGIPESERDAVFRPFHRLDPSRSSRTGGSGLGLAIVRQIANANGWSVTLHERPGGGTMACVRLPKTHFHSP
jgi:two-component system osmolarity sensor histidine kinase EnvZ